MTWFDTVSKKKEKGVRKLEKALLAEGYKMVEIGQGSLSSSNQNRTGGKHTKIKVMRLEELNIPNAQVVEVPVSSAVIDGKKNIKMVIREIKQKFSGRKGRGQGSFKLSNDKTNTWQSILKSSNPLSPDFVVPEIPDRIVRMFGNRYVKDAELMLNSYPILNTISVVYQSSVTKENSRDFFAGIGRHKDTIDYHNGLGVIYSIVIDELIKDLKFGVNPLTIMEELKDFMNKFTNYFVSYDTDYKERRDTSKKFVDGIKVLIKELLVTVGTDNTVGSQSKDKVTNEIIAESMIEFKNTNTELLSLEDIIQQKLEQKMQQDKVFNVTPEEFTHYLETMYSDFYDYDFDNYDDMEETQAYQSEEGPEDLAESRLEEGLRNRRNTNG